MSPREYLIDRFRSDAETLRQRAAALRNGPPQPGPDAATSLRMAEACDDVRAMIEAIPESDEVAAMLSSLTALVPLLEQRATGAAAPPVRAVYAGAATRIREVANAEQRASAGAPDADDAPDEIDAHDEDDDE